MTRQIPVLTLLLSALACLLMCLPLTAHELLYFDYQRLLEGQWWKAVSGHWIHADASHLLWNVVALGVLAAIIERRSRALLLWSLAIGCVFVDILLFSPLSSLQRYCGLSGILNTLLGVVLYLYWRETRSPLVLVTGLLCVGKIALEIVSGESVFTDISWPPFAMAHLAGLVAAPVVLWICQRKDYAGAADSRSVPWVSGTGLK
jgi:rhomboid family GlyGly-CTERM serine protease